VAIDNERARQKCMAIWDERRMSGDGGKKSSSRDGAPAHADIVAVIKLHARARARLPLLFS
jgi:hypothetical protein